MKAPSRLVRAEAVGLLLSAVVALTIPMHNSASAVTAQRGVTVLTAPIVQPGKHVASSWKSRLSGTVRFKPARMGRPVVIQRRVGARRWVNVAKKRENRAGVVSFTAAPRAAGGSPYIYRGVAARWHGLKKLAARAQSADVWTPRFTDEFKTFDPKKWSDRVSQAKSRPCADVGNPDAREVSGGALLLKVLRDPDRTDEICKTDSGRFGYYLNGQVGTQQRVSFNKGTFAARVRFPRDRGQHGAFWLQPDNLQYLEGHPGQSGAEVDVAEFFGKGYPDGGMASLVYNYGINGGETKIGGVAAKATAMLPSGDRWWTSYHVFALEWTKRAYIFRVDGRKHFRTTRGVSDIPEYMILSLLTSNWELADAKKLGITPHGTMSVDWVRVWQR